MKIERNQRNSLEQCVTCSRPSERNERNTTLGSVTIVRGVSLIAYLVPMPLFSLGGGVAGVGYAFALCIAKAQSLIAPTVLVARGPNTSVAFFNEPLPNCATIRQTQFDKWSLERVQFSGVLYYQSRDLEVFRHPSVSECPDMCFVSTICISTNFGCIESRNIGGTVAHRAEVNSVAFDGIAIYRNECCANQYFHFQRLTFQKPFEQKPLYSRNPKRVRFSPDVVALNSDSHASPEDLSITTLQKNGNLAQ
jgi:hypothetical protein